MNDDISGYIIDDYEGVNHHFTECEALPTEGAFDLYKAKRYGRWYMLKCLKPTFAHDPAHQQLLRKEFEVAVALQHSAVMQVMGMETVALPQRGETPCMVAEWIEGRTLDAYLAENPSQRERRRVATELAEAVAYIHSMQVVHRDLKPTNIMVTTNGDYAKVIDFGLADTSTHAILKQPAGTMRYMAPEQAERAVADVRNDIYSLGIIFREMGLRGYPYQKIINRCLRPVDQRFQQMDELLAMLHSTARRRLAWAAAALVVAAVIGLLLWQIGHLRRQALLMERTAAEQQLRLRILNHEIIGFEDPVVKRLCVSHWDTDGDQQLSFAEAAAVKDLGSVFTADTLITSFNELEHFTGLTDIAPEAFRDCSRLQTVRLPRSVRFIRHDAFRHTALEWFTFPGTVAGLGDHILEDCPRLETVVFEARLPDTNMTEESELFVGCPRLTTIFVPRMAMMGLLRGRRYKEEGKDLEWAVEHDQEHSHAVWEWAAYGSVFDKMTEHLRFADPVVKDLCVRRWDRDADRELSIDEVMAVDELGAAFCANEDIVSFDELRFFRGLEQIPASAFEQCSNLRSVCLPGSLKVIGDYAFYNCGALGDVDVSLHVERIGHHAFWGCGLSRVSLPASVTSLAATSFGGNPQLREVEVSPDNPVYDSREHCNAIIETATGKMVMGSVTAFFPRSVDKMSDETFTLFHRDTLTMPIQVTRMGRWAMNLHVRRVCCEAPLPPLYETQDAALFSDSPKGERPVVVVPIGAAEAYRHAHGWERLNIVEGPIAVPFSLSYELSVILRQIAPPPLIIPKVAQ